ncbi:MAG: NAD(+)/NADH kinase [Chloroflexota bacterium]|nr:NAD(+)/NADH kinase [Chloroflexota bacterium]
MSQHLVGIVANPASGKDIRRLVAHGSTFDNNEKINIVRRVLLGLEATGVSQVRFMPDTYAIVERAASALDLHLDLAPLPMPVLGNHGDNQEAAQRLADLGAGCIITLGGDGTNRVVAKGCSDVPLVPISTGTNNVFPRMIEGTIAGLAADLVATGATSGDDIVTRRPRLDVLLDGKPKDLALVDVVTSRQGFIGAQALWDPGHVKEVVLSRVAPAEIGMASLGGLLFPDAFGGSSGAYIAVGSDTANAVADATVRCVLAPLAPGLIRRVPIASTRLLETGEAADLRQEPCVVALDGEREFEVLRPDQHLRVILNPHGPRVVDINAALQAGAATGAFTVETTIHQ